MDQPDISRRGLLKRGAAAFAGVSVLQVAGVAEAFAKSQGCDEVWSNAAVEAVGFYERCGYARDLSEPAPVNSIRVRRVLCLKSRTSGLDTVSTGSGSDLVSDQHPIFPNDS